MLLVPLILRQCEFNCIHAQCSFITRFLTLLGQRASSWVRPHTSSVIMEQKEWISPSWLSIWSHKNANCETSFQDYIQLRGYWFKTASTYTVSRSIYLLDITSAYFFFYTFFVLNHVNSFFIINLVYQYWYAVHFDWFSVSYWSVAITISERFSILKWRFERILWLLSSKVSFVKFSIPRDYLSNSHSPNWTS